ncbi:cytochrome c [Geobacter pickeringii]|uniref:Cytochrome C n=1 Tax=Geobacter pickeringii TaxID=345632 RepID=A0A0B5BBW0_9BACT|nr:cytochrome c [Geobacter pickeringii]AJE02504.1 cytochrome C [Geobacter pickeringii]
MKRIATAIAALLAMAAPAMAGHTAAVGQGSCSYCHKTNLITQHGGFAATVCQTCHDSTASFAQAVFATISSGRAGLQYSCSNCHGSASHTEKHPGYIANWSTMNGVQPGAAASWTQPTTFTPVTPATLQSQLCLKCHSSNGFGAAAGGVSGIVGPTGKTLTDQALEFNPANRSAHPVIVSLNNQTGSLAPRALPASALKAPWSNVGNQVMSCSDCHDLTVSGTTGPQGATYTWSLKGANKAWPYTVAGVSSGTYQTTSNNSMSFCWNCHNFTAAGAPHTEGDHNGVACISCHIRVPHGGKVSRLIATATAGLPAYQKPDGKGAGPTNITAFKKASSPNNYSESNCSTNCGEHGAISGAETW